MSNIASRILQIKPWAWASLVSQILIVVTGGAVRLTGSGLGCPTWPECEPGSIVNVPELGYHGLIEFANRVLTIVLLVVSIATFVAVLRIEKARRKGLFWTSLVLGLGIVAQAVIGGISVLTGLNSWVVGSHFLVSAALICVATILLWHSYGAAFIPATGIQKIVIRVAFPIGLLAVALGVIVTGAGPHAGDQDTPRNGLNIDLWVHYHSYPAYLTLGLALLIFVFAIKSKINFTSSLLLLVVLSLQAMVGILQTKLGLPIGLVAIHMLGAATICSLLTWQQVSRGTWMSKR